MRAAMETVHRNLDRITGTLRAVGAVDGQAADADGKLHGYHVSAVLFYLAPRGFRFDLKKFGERQLLVGSNDADYWVYTKEDDSYQCGRHGQPSELSRALPIQPDQMVEALGLTPLPSPAGGFGRRRMVQRVDEDYQQILILIADDHGQPVIEREYWLDRYAPGLVRRVVFRDADGVVEMASLLDDYRRSAGDGPLLPHTLTLEWPCNDARMRFHVDRWSVEPQIGPDGPQFATPAACRR
jgi:hypothetical protein